MVPGSLKVSDSGPNGREMLEYSMTPIIIGLALFILTHMIPSAASLRTAMVSNLGSNGYQGIFSLLALTGLILIVYGKTTAPAVELWTPPDWGIAVAHSVMPVAFILLCAAFVPNSIKRVSRHPMLWGIFLWTTLHLLANGDLASLLLFAGMGVFAIIKIVSIGDRQTRELGAKVPITKDLILVVIGLIDYGVFLYFHRVGGAESSTHQFDGIAGKRILQRQT